MKIWAGRGWFFLGGGGLPLLLSPLFPLLGAGLLLRCVEAAAAVGSWPAQASHRASAAFTMAAAVLWRPAPTVSLMDGRRWIKKKKVIVRWYSWREMLFELSQENTGLKALHFHGKAKQFKVRLPLLFPNCPSKVFFKKLNSSADLIPYAANWASMRQNQMGSSSSS
jgi:hypothetical protein